MDLNKVRELLELVAESGVAEVEIEEDDFKLTVRRNAPTITMQQPPQGIAPGQGGYASYVPPQVGGGAQPQAPPPPSGAGRPQQGTGQGATNEAPAEAAEAPQEEDVAAGADEETVTAPIVGTFYRRPSPDDDPYVEVGDTVTPGDVLCIIEAMKLMNEIECEAAGTIKKILVEDAEPIEYEQPLFVIEKE